MPAPRVDCWQAAAACSPGGAAPSADQRRVLETFSLRSSASRLVLPAARRLVAVRLLRLAVRARGLRLEQVGEAPGREGLEAGRRESSPALDRRLLGLGLSSSP